LIALLSGVPAQVVVPQDLGKRFEVEETGETYLANARLKAEAGLRLSGLPSLADDSGLEVEALGGRPGVHSARFAGRNATQADRIRALLEQLRDQQDRPVALFRAVAVIALPDGRRFEGEGLLEGTIAREPKGSGGFGFDPIFTVADGRRLAELPLEEKNLISHRARALAELEVRGAFDAVLRS
jgi:XTP/dITP diphosphohydrolase